MWSKAWQLVVSISFGYMAYHVAIEQGLRRPSSYIGFGEASLVIAAGFGLVAVALLFALVRSIIYGKTDAIKNDGTPNK